MTETTRRFLVAGNWKMNGNKALVQTIVSALNAATYNQSVDVVIAPPAPYLDMTRQTLRKDLFVASQNVHAAQSGAFTGELSYEMLKDLNVNWTIIGHSERREIFKESDEVIAQKTVTAATQGLNVMFCIGEKLEEREAGKTTEVCFRQLAALSKVLPTDAWKSIIVAYEPVWAIGTGKVATPQQAQDVHADIRAWLNTNVSKAVADETRILYGGSVNAKNCVELSKCNDIDGFLVGGASLKAADFVSICQCKN